MFTFDNKLKSWVLSKLNSESGNPGTFYFLLERYWDQLILYLLLSPFQWLHVTHMLYATHWDEYGLVAKLIMLFYAAACFAFWEGARIFMYYTFRSIEQGQDPHEMTKRIISATSDLGKEMYQRAGPMLASLSNSVQGLVHQALDQVQQTASQLQSQIEQQRTIDKDHGTSTGGSQHSQGGNQGGGNY